VHKSDTELAVCSYDLLLMTTTTRNRTNELGRLFKTKEQAEKERLKRPERELKEIGIGVIPTPKMA
jgi:hypothetical protein